MSNFSQQKLRSIILLSLSLGWMKECDEEGLNPTKEHVAVVWSQLLNDRASGMKRGKNVQAMRVDHCEFISVQHIHMGQMLPLVLHRVLAMEKMHTSRCNFVMPKAARSISLVSPPLP